MLGSSRRLAIVACLFLFARPALSAGADDPRPARIVVNGRAIVSDVAPVIEQHRILVPIRAVFAALGAYVDFDARTKTVIVARPRTTIELRVFSQRADVDGNTVWLDEPAVLRHGRTMVPLRFIAEASGADVAFDEARNAADVTLAGASLGFGPTIPRSATSSPVIASLSVDTHGKKMLVAGDVLQVNAAGTPRGTATFDLAGIVAGSAMHEITAGTYSGFYVVRAGRNVNDVHAYAHLAFNGRTATATSTESFSVAGRAPSVVASSPKAGERTFVVQPSISAAIDDHGGPAVDAESLRVYMDGTDVTPYSGVSARSLYFTPYYPLAPGWHRVGVYGDDVAGVPFSSDWSFFVEPFTGYGYGGTCCAGYGFNQGGFPIFSLTPMQFGTFGPGSVITLILQGVPGGYGIASIVGAGGSIMLDPVAGMPGYYVGSYIVPPGLDLWPVSFNVDYFGHDGVTAHAHEGSGLRFVSTLAARRPRTQPVVRRPVFATGVVDAGRAAGAHGSVDKDQPVVRRPPRIAPLPVMAFPKPEDSPLPAVSPRPIVVPRPVVTVRPVIAPRPIATPPPVVTSRPLITPPPIATPRPVPTALPLITPRPVATRVAPPSAAPMVTARPQASPTPKGAPPTP